MFPLHGRILTVETEPVKNCQGFLPILQSTRLDCEASGMLAEDTGLPIQRQSTLLPTATAVARVQHLGMCPRPQFSLGNIKGAS